jgi:hypothetical protein
MGARILWTDTQSNNHRPVEYVFSVTSLTGAASAPTFLEGDGFNGLNQVTNTSSGTYLTVGRTGVGVYTFTTVDPYPGFINQGWQLAAATPVGQLTITASLPTQNANGTWTVTINVYSGATAHELAAGDILYGYLRLRNGSNTP